MAAHLNAARDLKIAALPAAPTGAKTATARRKGHQYRDVEIELVPDGAVPAEGGITAPDPVPTAGQKRRRRKEGRLAEAKRQRYGRAPGQDSRDQLFLDAICARYGPRTDLRPSEVGELMGVATETVNGWINTGALPATSPGCPKQRFIEIGDFVAFARSGPVKHMGTSPSATSTSPATKQRRRSVRPRLIREAPAAARVARRAGPRSLR